MACAYIVQHMSGKHAAIVGLVRRPPEAFTHLNCTLAMSQQIPFCSMLPGI